MKGHRPISGAELSAIQKRAEAASAGPWRSIVEGRDQPSGDSFIMVGLDDGQADMYVFRDRRPAAAADLDFIAAARQDIPRLIAKLRRLRGEL